MTPAELEKLRFPIGKYEDPKEFTSSELHGFISEIASFPDRLKEAVLALNDEQLDTPYRPDGWTIRQVVHHCADSHLNSVTRFRLALTEDRPVIKPYFEERWAELEDAKTMSIAPSLLILNGLHKRWVTLLKSLSEEQLQKTFVHPEHGKELQLKSVIALYAWHGNHHLAQITTLIKKQNWK